MAARVFQDSYKLIREDREERYNNPGKVGRVLFVVCVFTKQNIVNMISSRLAAVPEKERYEYGKDDI